MIGPDTYADTLKEAFSNGDCWALALALGDRHEDLTVCVVGEYSEDGTEEDAHTDDDLDIDWVHMLVRDDRDPDLRTYVDILGEHTTDEVLDDWDWHPDWEEIIPLDPDTATDHAPPRDRFYPEVTVDEAIALMTAEGWAPPPLRSAHV